MELQTKALTILSQFMTAEESRSVIRNCPKIVPFALRAYRNARSQPDRQTTLYSSQFPSEQILRLLKIFSAVDDSVAERLVCEEGLAEISAAIQLDPNRENLREVLYGTEILSIILGLENGRRVQRVQKEKEIIAGIHRDTL